MFIAFFIFTLYFDTLLYYKTKFPIDRAYNEDIKKKGK